MSPDSGGRVVATPVAACPPVPRVTVTTAAGTFTDTADRAGLHVLAGRVVS